MQTRNGQSLIEVLVAAAIGAILITSAVTIIAPTLKSSKSSIRIHTAASVGNELLESIRTKSEEGWYRYINLATTSAYQYYFNASSSPYGIATGTQSGSLGSTAYLRYFYIDDVGRDGAGNILASGGTDDPSTMKATVVYGPVGGPTSSIVTYLTRFRHHVWEQTDWSQGILVADYITSTSTTGFTTSTSNINVATSTGSIMLNL